MADLNDRNTDALFQAGAERHEFGYNPDAWALMEAKLDAQEAAVAAAGKPVWKRYLPVLLLGLLLVGGLGYYLLEGDGATGVEVVAEVPAFIPAGTDAARVSGSGLEALTQGAGEGLKAGVEQVEAAALAVDGIKAPVRVRTSGLKSTGGFNTQGEAVFSRVSGSDLEVLNLGAADQEVPIDLNAVGDFTTQTSTTELTRAGKPSAVSLLPTDDLASIEVPAQPITVPAIVMQEGSVTSGFKATTTDRWALSASAGIISGRSQGVDLPRAQPRFGLLADYRVGSNLILSTGALYSMVHYRIEGRRYEAKAGFFIDDVQPVEVKAACSIVEIPLHATYYFSGSRGSSFFAGAGAVSYVLLKENYKYDYAEDNARFKKEWEETNANQHPFGLGQVNFGYQRRLPGRGAVQLETYAHLPLTGLGHGNVRLTSVGVSLKYQFSFGRQ